MSRIVFDDSPAEPIEVEDEPARGLDVAAVAKALGAEPCSEIPDIVKKAWPLPRAASARKKG